MDRGWQKAMPEHDKIELWDISALDSFNKKRAAGGHQGHCCGHWGMTRYRRGIWRRRGETEGGKIGGITMSLYCQAMSVAISIGCNFLSN